MHFHQCQQCGFFIGAHFWCKTNVLFSVPERLNSAPCGILANLPILMFLVCTIVALFWYMIKFWGIFRYITHLLSVLSYEAILLEVALICTVSNTMRYIHRASGKKNSSWWQVLHQDYIARRLLSLTGTQFRLPGVLFIFFTTVWILAINALHVLNGIQILSAAMDNKQSYTPTTARRELAFTLFKLVVIIGTSVVGLPLFACFWYYVLVMRMALTAEFNLVLVFIKRYEGNLALCRRRIAEINHEFCLLRRVLTFLMPFIMASAVLGITVHITWNYEVYSGTKMYLANENLLINIVIFNEKFLVLILPLLAVGGINIDDVWVQFNYALSRQRSCRHEAFWDRLLAFSAEIHEESKGHNFTIILSAISVFLGQNITNQKLDYRGELLI